MAQLVEPRSREAVKQWGGSNELDDRFSKYPDNLSELLYAHVQANTDAFGDLGSE